MADTPQNSRTRLLGATLDLVRTHGYAATRVEDVCAAAGVTKGSFFHHFASKEDLAIAAAVLWDQNATQLFTTADFQSADDPLRRLLGYVNFRRGLVTGEMHEWTCYAGTTIQEVHESHPQIRDACAVSINHHLDMLTVMIEEVLRVNPVSGIHAATLAVFIQAVLQGAFVMAKASQDRQPALDSIDHLQRYLSLLFQPKPQR